MDQHSHDYAISVPGSPWGDFEPELPFGDRPDARNARLVSVIIPVFNGAGTIEETLRSVFRQSYRQLEIIVVDDGSRDDTAMRVMRLMREEPRLSLMSQANAGVAHARNAGARRARGNYLAFLDADDLWHPDKIRAQMAVLEAASPRVGMVYSWFAHIDEKGEVFSLEHRPEAEGMILPDLCRRNLVGNGSSALFRRAAFERAGGYDVTLHQRDAQGCEDLAICLKVAEHYEARVVRRHHVGYRLSRDNMSGDVLRMSRSARLVLSGYGEQDPRLRERVSRHLIDMDYWLMVRAAAEGKLGPALILASGLLARAPGWLLARLPHFLCATARATAPRWIKRLFRSIRGRSPDAGPATIFAGKGDALGVLAPKR